MARGEPVLSRRALLRAAAVGGLGIPLLSSCTSRGPAPVGSAPTPRSDPVSVAMHLHSSFSEGTASMATHLDQARRLGVDVLFWTDHDFRLSAQGYRRRLGLAGRSDSEHGVEVSWQPRTEGGSTGAVAYGGGAATLTARGAGAYWLDAHAWNSTYSGSLADTTLAVELRPGPGAALQLDLSYQPASGGRDAGRYRLTYRFGPSTRDRRAAGREGTVDLPAAAGWSTVDIDPVADIRALWPDLVAEDNSMFRLRVGVLGAGTAAFRQIAITRARRADSLALMRDVMSRYAQRHPATRQYAALEVSLVRHLNWFGGKLVMPDYGSRAPVQDDEIPAAQEMVRFIHDHGGIASYNHPLAGSPAATAAHMVATRALGADVVEVAYGGSQSTVEGMLQVLDACARNGVHVTANGVTDDHDGTDWYGSRANWITRLWARSAELPDLQAALRAGRAFAYKPDGWNGTLEVAAGGRPAMGAVAVTGGRAVPVTVTATDLPRDGRLEVVTGPVDRAAPAPAIGTVRSHRGSHSLDLPADHYVRAVVRDAAGRIVGVGNPLWAATDAATAPAHRRLQL
jgi:predicted metal-dependent phosphoesterase TrpH